MVCPFLNVCSNRRVDEFFWRINIFVTPVAKFFQVDREKSDWNVEKRPFHERFRPFDGHFWAFLAEYGFKTTRSKTFMQTVGDGERL